MTNNCYGLIFINSQNVALCQIIRVSYYSSSILINYTYRLSMTLGDWKEHFQLWGWLRGESGPRRWHMLMGSSWGRDTGRTRYSTQPFLVLKGRCILSPLNFCGTQHERLLSLISCVYSRPIYPI